MGDSWKAELYSFGVLHFQLSSLDTGKNCEGTTSWNIYVGKNAVKCESLTVELKHL